jgi:uncharacterized protein YggU (UPF0235/DUF167 family)
MMDSSDRPWVPVVVDTASGARLDIRVVPRASRNGIDGVRDGRVVVRVTAAPEDGAATAAAVAVVAAALDVAPTTIHVVSGRTSRNKVVAVGRLNAAQVVAKLASAPGRAGGSTESRPRDRRTSAPPPSRNR